MIGHFGESLTRTSQFRYLSSRGVPRRIDLIPLVAVLVLVAGLPAVSSLEDGRIGVLYVGCMARSTPFWWMRSDPLFSINFVQATLRDWSGAGPTQVAKDESHVLRMVRLYMPRSVSDLAARFDVIIMANANRQAVSPKNIQMLTQGVREAEIGLVMFGGWESFGGAFGRPAWGDSSIGDLLPTEDAAHLYIHKPANSFSLKIDKPDHEFMGSLPWDKTQPFMYNFHHNLVRARPGADVLAHVESIAFKDHPGLVTWELETGARTFSITGEILGPSSEPNQVHTMCSPGNPWEYALDFGGNLMIYLDRRPVPQDVNLVHTLRQRMFEAGNRKSMLVGVIEFADSFGANTVGINRELDDVNQLISDALPQYLDLQFEEVLEAYGRVNDRLVEIEEDAVELKNRALLWVYIVEWLTVSGTGMVTGFFLWSVMVRRRLYREVGTTKLTAYDI
jgi:uncharacterized membrane protein